MEDRPVAFKDDFDAGTELLILHDLVNRLTMPLVMIRASNNDLEAVQAREETASILEKLKDRVDLLYQKILAGIVEEGK